METFYPEIHNFHCDMDIELKPSLTEANVQTHTILLDIMEKCRRLRPEDCCKYCAVYSNNLTSVQHKEIEKWRQDVNDAINPPKRITKPKRRSAKDINYRPPGKPDETEGFRRVPVPSASRSTPRKSSRISQISREKRGINAPAVTNTCRKQSGIAKDTDNNIKEAELDSVEIVSLNSNNEDPEMYAIRSASNDLLNVMTIDDCKIVHDHKKAGMDLDQHLHASKNLKEKEKHPLDREVRFKTDSASSITNQTSPLPAIVQENSDTDDEYYDLLTEPNETVIKALDNIIHNNKVTYNTAKRGLFKYDKGYKPMSANTYESDRFRKLNDKLHKVMEEKYLVNPRTRNRIQRYYSKHRNSESGDMSSGKLRKLRVTTPEISRSRQQSRLQSWSTTESKVQHDSFLGMLMDMDTGIKIRKEAI